MSDNFEPLIGFYMYLKSSSSHLVKQGTYTSPHANVTPSAAMNSNADMHGARAEPPFVVDEVGGADVDVVALEAPLEGGAVALAAGTAYAVTPVARGPGPADAEAP